MTQSVGIIGHGLTGITAAIMLARAGYQVDLIGPKPQFSGGLQLAPNGLAALQTLGHYKAVRKKAVRLESIRITAMHKDTIDQFFICISQRGTDQDG